MIGGSLLLCVLAVHESRPIFEKSKEVYRIMSKRFSSRLNDGVGQNAQPTIDASKTYVDSDEKDSAATGKSFVKDDSFQSNEMTNIKVGCTLDS